ncbi:Fmu domain-containing protein [Alicycliphilus sp. B1]|nr:Fmu domain-containing protein [Alicycliphilus sp. B1]
MLDRGEFKSCSHFSLESEAPPHLAAGAPRQWDNRPMHPKALLDACAELVRLTLTFEHPADAVVSRYFRDHRELGPRERATLAETAYAVLRRKPLFEQLARSGSGPKERRLAILGFASQLDEQARRADPSARRGPRDFLKSALTAQEKDWLDACDGVREDELLEPQRHNLPQWLAAPLKAQLGDEFWALAASLQEQAPLDLRVNTLQAKREDMRKELAQAGVQAAPTPYSPWGLRVQGKPALSRLDAFARGALEVQDEGSQLLALLLDAKRGEMVVDFCAGAGGKTLAIGAAMRNTGRLYAFDVSGHRLDALKPRLARSGLSNVHPAALAHERDERVKRLAGKIDRVLVDAPCSGLGTLRRNPDLKWRQGPQAVQELAAKQTAILESAARLVKSGGRLVYATCSMLPEENEAIAEAFGAAHPDFAPLAAGELLAQLKVEQAAGLCSGGDDGMRYLRLWPHRHQTDGFFAAVWQKK